MLCVYVYTVLRYIFDDSIAISFSFSLQFIKSQFISSALS